jgi:hypothetical protein
MYDQKDSLGNGTGLIQDEDRSDAIPISISFWKAKRKASPEYSRYLSRI